MIEYHLGLIGYPLEHSLSPRIHSYFLSSCNLRGSYRLFPVPNDSTRDARLRELLGKVARGEIQGFNVTIPHKQSVLPFVDNLTPEARILQAVNTIYPQEGKLVGANTDVGGFRVDLQLFIEDKERGNALVLGAGGAARAVVFALLQMGWDVCVAARKVQQAEELRRYMYEGLMEDSSLKHPSITTLTLSGDDLLSAEEQRHFDLVVNTTPLGMAGYPQISPLPEDFPLRQGVWVYDLVYNPPETVLLSWAKSKGAWVRNGLGMLIEQARLAFEIWTGVKPEYTDEFSKSLWS